MNRGITDPREAMTLPERVQQIVVVGAQGDDPLDTLGEGGVQDILGAKDVGLHCFEGIELAGRDLLQGCGLEDVIDTLHGRKEVVVIPDIIAAEATFVVHRAITICSPETTRFRSRERCVLASWTLTVVAMGIYWTKSMTKSTG